MLNKMNATKINDFREIVIETLVRYCACVCMWQVGSCRFQWRCKARSSGGKFHVAATEAKTTKALTENRI